MTDLRRELRSACQGRVLVLGLGNPVFGDDALGVVLAERLQAAAIADVQVAGACPERYLSMAAGMDTVLLLDAVDAGLEPGTVVLLTGEEVRTRFPQFSTHRISLALLSRVLEDTWGSKVALLGVQPASLSPGGGLSRPVRATLRVLERLLVETLPVGKTGSAPREGCAHGAPYRPPLEQAQ